jgi:hypothetical protein
MAFVRFGKSAGGYVLSMLMVFCFIGPAAAQGIFGSSVTDVASLGGSFSGSSGCGASPWARLGTPVFYVGWTGDRNGTTYELSNDGGSLSHRFPLRGIWVGIGETVALTDTVDALLSGWTLVQATNVAMDEMDDLSPYQWKKTPTNWYFVDGLLAYKSCGAFAALAGFRYEYFTSNFRRLRPPVSDDTGDVKISSYIPLLGLQWHYCDTDTSILFRTVGFPVQFGRFTLMELFGGDPAQWNGDYKNGYFLEIFSEYSKKVSTMQIGVFGRWNLSHTTASPNLNAGGGSSDLGFQRTTWTFGGNLSVAFNTPL